MASAQFDNQWASFTQDNSKLGPNPTSISNETTTLPGDTSGFGLTGTETDFAWGDLDKDGWTDLVIVRKQPFTSAGKRTNLLLMNNEGLLQDRTALFASASDVAGDNGFLTATNDRDVFVADVDGDTWLDVITATTISDSDPKHVGHPRIYMNLGVDGAGAWLGLEHQDARMPQMVSFTTGNPTNPRFCSVAVGDVTGDGLPELWFGDYDSSGAGGVFQPPGSDMNDRLLINDGSGFFTDESQLRLDADMLQAAFGAASVIADFNGDGMNDIAKQTALNPPQDVRIIYNGTGLAPGEGFFDIQDKFHTFAPYHINAGDLNQDGDLDMIFSDDGLDRYRINTGVDPLGRVIWSSAFTYDFLSGNDDGFSSNNLIVDIDGDGWGDTLHTDIDVDIPGGNRRLHIYHNLGGTPGGTDIVLREERENTSSAGWIGVVGLTTDSMRGTHDVAVFDIDNDTDLDMVISREAGTDVYTQDGGVVCQKSVGFGGPGFSVMTVCGEDVTTIGNSADAKLTGAPASSPSAWVLGNVNSPVALFGGFIVPSTPILTAGFTTDANGEILLPDAIIGNGGGQTLYLQALTFDAGIPTAWDVSTAVEIQL
ncbi:MAG: hypothetical protein AAF682_17430 [Planctomycetota bacterium]